MTANRVLIIAGPTASGKTALAIRRAQQKNGVIINADSMQVYDALPILTAQPTAEERAMAPHLLYGALAPHEQCTAAKWSAMALAAIETALAGGRLPIVTGGTGLYIKALTEGLSPIPEIPPQVRANAMARLEEIGHDAFHAQLAGFDPAAAARIAAADSQRMTRAWEVYHATGKSISEWQAVSPVPPRADIAFHLVLVMPERAALAARSDARFDAMLEQGALDEARAFDARFPDAAFPVTQALGFTALRDYLRGALTLPEAAEIAKNQTRQYAKRQATWFRGQVKPSGNLTIEIL